MSDAIRYLVNGQPQELANVDDTECFHPIDFNQPLTERVYATVYDQFDRIKNRGQTSISFPALNFFRDNNYMDYAYDYQGDKLMMHVDHARKESHVFWDFLNRDGNRNIRNFTVIDDGYRMRTDAAGRNSLFDASFLLENGEKCLTKRFSDLFEYRCISSDEIESLPMPPIAPVPPIEPEADSNALEVSRVAYLFFTYLALEVLHAFQWYGRRPNT